MGNGYMKRGRGFGEGAWLRILGCMGRGRGYEGAGQRIMDRKRRGRGYGRCYRVGGAEMGGAKGGCMKGVGVANKWGVAKGGWRRCCRAWLRERAGLQDWCR